MKPESLSSRAPRRGRGDRGSALVEFAIVAPLGLMLLFGIIEFGFLFGQKLDVAQGTRELARLAAVSHQTTDGSSGATQTSEIVAEACSRMEVAANTRVTISFPGNKAVGDTVNVKITTTADLVTGAFDTWFANATISNELETRLEQIATFDATTNEPCP